MSSVFVERVVLRNYKSIAHCDIQLGPLTYLVGANGAGKSNFIDALHLVSDALQGSLANALNERGGLGEVRRRSSGHPVPRLPFQCCRPLAEGDVLAFPGNLPRSYQNADGVAAARGVSVVVPARAGA